MSQHPLSVVPASPARDPSDTSLWTVKECAAFLGTTKHAIYHRVEIGQLPCVRMGGGPRARLRFIPARIRQWVLSHEVAP